MDRGAWWAILHGVAKGQTGPSDIHTHTHTHTRAQAVMQAMGVVVNKNEASLSHPPLTCHAAQVLTGYKSVPVHDPQVGNP